MTNVFISYSRIDEKLVGPIVGLLRASKVLVFKDTDSILPGKKWRSELKKAIKESDILVVFWCHHSANSTEVRQEFEAGIALGKDIIPILLDNTPLVAELAEFQFIDFCVLVNSTHIQCIAGEKSVEIEKSNKNLSNIGMSEKVFSLTLRSVMWTVFMSVIGVMVFIFQKNILGNDSVEGIGYISAIVIFIINLFLGGFWNLYYMKSRSELPRAASSVVCDDSDKCKVGEGELSDSEKIMIAAMIADEVMQRAKCIK